MAETVFGRSLPQLPGSRGFLEGCNALCFFDRQGFFEVAGRQDFFRRLGPRLLKSGCGRYPPHALTRYGAHVRPYLARLTGGRKNHSERTRPHTVSCAPLLAQVPTLTLLRSAAICWRCPTSPRHWLELDRSPEGSNCASLHGASGDPRRS